MTVIRVAFVVLGVLVVPHAGRAQAPAASQPAPAGVQISPAPASPAPASPVAAPTAPLTAAQIRYNEMLERVKAGDPSVDFAVFRDAFTETPAYRANMMSAYQALWQPLNSGNFPAALQIAEKVLGVNYVEINAHMVASVAQQQLGNAARAAFHRNIAEGLLRVVMSKGDGATSETAWPVIDISEEYAVMRVLGLSAQKQSLSMKPDGSGPKVDVLEAIDQRTKMPRTVYFNVDRSMAATLASVTRQQQQPQQQQQK